MAVTSAPVIVGSPYFGATLVPSGGAWQSPNPGRKDTEAWWEWWRCPSSASHDGCDFRTRSENYFVSGSDANAYLVLVRYVRWRDSKGKGKPHDDTFVQQWRASAPAGPVRARPSSTPVPTPVPTVIPTPTPTPDPGFDSAATTPVTTHGEVLQETARARRVVRPFPIVRIKGRLTANGADIDVLSVRAPRAAKVSVRCQGRSCPASRWSRTARKSRLTRMKRFERSFRAGVKITVSVTRRGYVGKRTTFVIRRGQAPSRSDRCLSSKGGLTRCPPGVS